jgi:hypothetical protein
MPDHGKNIVCMVLVSVGLGNASSGHTLAFKLYALLQAIRELQRGIEYAGVDSIRDYLLVQESLRSESEVSKLLKLASKLGLIEEGRIPSTWRVIWTPRNLPFS